MTVFPAAPASAAAAAAAASHGAPASLPDWLAGEWQPLLERAAAAAGVSVSEACGQWVREGLESFEARQAAAEAAGRCSLRTGTVTAGPVPLPVQQ